MRVHNRSKQKGSDMNVLYMVGAVSVLTTLSAPVQAQDAQKFDLAGVTVSMEDGGWEIHDVKSKALNVGAQGIDGSISSEAKLLIKRSADAKVLTALIVKGSRGTSQAIAFRDSDCPKVQTNIFYARKLSAISGGAPKCLFIGGPFQGPNSLGDLLRAAQTDHPFEAPTLNWMLAGYVYNTNGAQFSVEGVVSADGFLGLPEVPPMGTVPAQMPPGVAAWGDALGVAMQKALNGFFSRSTTLPAMNFSGTRLQP